jgi:hypothetical protein
MGDVIGFQEWKEKKELQHLEKKVRGIFSEAIESGELKINYFIQ